MRTKKFMAFGLYILLGCLILSVWSSNVAANTDIKISKIEYLVNSFHPSYFGLDEDSSVPRLFLNVYVTINNLNKNIKSIKEVKFTDSLDNSYVINLKEQTKNIKNDFIRIIYVNTKLSEKSALLPTKYKVTITTKDDQVIEEQFSVAEPGSNNANNKSYLYNEAYRGKVDKDYFQALKMGTIKAARIENKTITIDFLVNEPRAFNGLIVFFDKKRNYIGESRLFKTAFSGEILNSLNNGEGFYINNKNNQIILTEAQINFEKGKKLSSVKYVMLMLTDGAQYANSDKPDLYDYASRSPLFEVQSF
ncbi:MAG TPA: hypothetical protein PLZ08_11195 [Bacillota bacterium]|nr:hypothetical protein [Bacillota bacterium]HOL10684.1 hypothetical protein [Bacillota bacterium]HPO98503.1 hypothetical protein [Bacillota bacterium]